MKIRLLWVLIGVIIVATAVIGCGKPDKEVDVAVNLQNASNVGSLQIEISYDASVLQAIKVEAEELGKNALIEFNLDKAGIIIIGIVDSSGINGSGSVASVSFDVLEKDSASSLIIKNVTAHDVDTLVDLPTTLTQGNFTSGDVSPPTISFDLPQ